MSCDKMTINQARVMRLLQVLAEEDLAIFLNDDGDMVIQDINGGGVLAVETSDTLDQFSVENGSLNMQWGK